MFLCTQDGRAWKKLRPAIRERYQLRAMV